MSTSSGSAYTERPPSRGSRAHLIAVRFGLEALALDADDRLVLDEGGGDLA